MTISSMSMMVSIGRVNVRTASPQSSKMTGLSVTRSAPTLMLRSTSTTELDSKEPDSSTTMDSRAVSEPSAMANRMW